MNKLTKVSIFSFPILLLSSILYNIQLAILGGAKLGLPTEFGNFFVITKTNEKLFIDIFNGMLIWFFASVAVISCLIFILTLPYLTIKYIVPFLFSRASKRKKKDIHLQ